MRKTFSLILLLAIVLTFSGCKADNVSTANVNTAKQTTISVPDYTMTYIGNKRTKKFHKESCHTLPDYDNRVKFSSREEAIDQNFSPCKNCNP